MPGNDPFSIHLEPACSDGDGASDAADNCPFVSNDSKGQDGDMGMCDPPADPDNEKAQCFIDLAESNAALFQAQRISPLVRRNASPTRTEMARRLDDHCPGTRRPRLWMIRASRAQS
jgi:hypothetical protein